MIDVDLAYPLSLGLVAAFNPCGFAMLPAYTSFFLGMEADDETNVARNIVRGLVVGLTMTMGFVAVFGLIGLLTSTLVSQSFLSKNAPYLTFAFGLAMIPLGLAMLRGFEPKVNLKRLQAGGKNTELPSIFLFGMSYAIASISCTIALFLGVIIDSFGSDGIVDGTAKLVAYATGMGLVIMVLTLSLAVARTSVATNMRRLLPHVNRVSGVLLVLAGSYLATYALWEIQLLRGDGRPWGWLDSIASTGEAVRNRVNVWIAAVGQGRLALAITVVILGALVWALSMSLATRDRRLLRGAFAAVWLALEALRYDFDLLLLPLLRTIVDAPERVLHWFTDPLRWPVVWELLAGAIITITGWIATRRALASEARQPVGASRV
jgi:cytochrome c-type biogenesis protein